MKGLWYSGKIIIVGINCPRSVVGVNAKLIGEITCTIIDRFADSIMLCVKVTLDILMPRRGDHFAVRAVPSFSAHDWWYSSNDAKESDGVTLELLQ